MLGGEASVVMEDVWILDSNVDWMWNSEKTYRLERSKVWIDLEWHLLFYLGREAWGGKRLSRYSSGW